MGDSPYGWNSTEKLLPLFYNFLSRFVFIQMLNPDRIKTYLTFDDVLLLPGHSKILPTEVNIKTQLTQKISINPSEHRHPHTYLAKRLYR